MAIDKNVSDSFLSDNHLLPNVFCYKDLGVSLDNYLPFDSHISVICRKCYYIINQLFRIFRTKNMHSLIQAYKRYCMPFLKYYSSIWTPNKHSKHFFAFVVIFLIPLLTTNHMIIV